MSTKEKWLRSHVERCLEDVWDGPAKPDSDGDYPFAGRTSTCWVRLETKAKPWVVSVFAYAAVGVTPKVRLLKELDAVAAAARAVSVFEVGGLVIVRQALLAESVDRPSLRFATSGVQHVADDIGEMVATVYGGQAPLSVCGLHRA
jgi:hypothetical protein